MSQSRPTSIGLLRAMLTTVAFVHDVPEADILSDSRFKEHARARHHFMAEAVATGRWSLPQIGAFIGRDHTTVLAGVRAHARRAAA